VCVCVLVAIMCVYVCVCVCFGSDTAPTNKIRYSIRLMAYLVGKEGPVLPKKERQKERQNVLLSKEPI